MAYLELEINARGWTSASLGQLAAEENSGSLTISLQSGQSTPTIEIAWDKRRNRGLRVRARPGGDPLTPTATAEDFFAAVIARHKQQQLDHGHRRYWLVYEGLPWSGELWLGDDIRLGPPSRQPQTQIGRQAVIVDAVVRGIGASGISANFARLIRELRLVLSPILGAHLEDVSQWTADWVPEIDEKGQIVDCRLRPVGYTETAPSPGMPGRGAISPCVREAIVRPGLGRYGIWPDDVSLKVPADTEILWRRFQSLNSKRQEQYLRACNAYDIARAMWPDQRTAYAVFLVVACEALKPDGKKYDRANVYDVVASLVGVAAARSLHALRLPPQSLRNKHVHRGVLAAGEEPSLLFGDPFRDPSFEDTITVLSQVARICLIEWLRRSGRYKLFRLSRP